MPSGRTDPARGPLGSSPARRRDPGPRPPSPAGAREPLEPVPAIRAAQALCATLAALAVARGALSFVPDMWAWSLNLHRYLDPVAAWGPWLIAAASLLPAVARRVARALERTGDLLSTRPVLAGWTLAGLAAALVASLPDRTRFVGDFLLRQGTVEQAGVPSQLFPQALPLDVFLHSMLPQALAAAGVLDANGAARLLGALEAAALAALAVAFARALSLRGIPAATATAIVFFGGYLGLFTGFGKAFSELVLIVAALGVCGLFVVRGGRGLLPLGIAFAVGLTLHRSALATVPAVVVVWGLWLRERGGDGGWKQPRVLLALAVPIAALAVMLPRIVAVMRRWDALHVASQEVQAEGGAVRAAFAAARLPDMLNLVGFLSPLALAAVPMLAVLGWKQSRRRECVLLLALALPMLVALPFIHPAQGLYRDWDDFAALGMGLSLVAAWLVAETLRAAPRFAWLGVAATLAVAVPAVQWLLHWTDVDRGLARVEAIMREPPPRTVTERSTTWDFVGIRNLRIGRLEAAAAAFSHSAEAAPSPRILLELGFTERERGNLRGAQQAYGRVVERDSTARQGWELYGLVSSQLGDTLAVRRARSALLGLDAGNPSARAFEAWLTGAPAGR